MSYRTIVSRLRRRGVIALPAVVAALALAPAANAATFVYTPGSQSMSSALNGAALQSAISSADANTGAQNIIQLCACLYQPTAQMVLTGNIEITGPPTFQLGAGQNQQPTVNGANQSPLIDLFAVNSGNVMFKAFNITASANTGFAGIHVNGGTAEVDNMGLDGEAGEGIIISNGTLAVTNSLVADSQIGIESDGGNLTLANDTITGNLAGGGVVGSAGGFIAGNVTMNNTLLGANFATDGITPENCGSAITSGSNNVADDSSCGSSTTVGTPNFGIANNNGGPTLSEKLTSPTGTANNALCAPADQRFFVRSGTSCDVGAYQTTAAKGNQTAGPVCTVPTTVNGHANPNYGVTPATMTVNATDANTGLGGDAMYTPVSTSTTGSQSLPMTNGTLNVTSTAGFSKSGGTINVTTSTGIQSITYTATTPTSFTGVNGGTTATVAAGSLVTGTSATTDNGTVSWSTVSGTNFALTNPGAPSGTGLFDLPTTSPFAVTATKSGVNNTVGDTHWSFTPTNWLGISTLCI